MLVLDEEELEKKPGCQPNKETMDPIDT